MERRANEGDTAFLNYQHRVFNRPLEERVKVPLPPGVVFNLETGIQVLVPLEELGNVFSTNGPLPYVITEEREIVPWNVYRVGFV